MYGFPPSTVVQTADLWPYEMGLPSEFYNKLPERNRVNVFVPNGDMHWEDDAALGGRSATVVIRFCWLKNPKHRHSSHVREYTIREPGNVPPTRGDAFNLRLCLNFEGSLANVHTAGARPVGADSQRFLDYARGSKNPVLYAAPICAVMREAMADSRSPDAPPVYKCSLVHYLDWVFANLIGLHTGKNLDTVSVHNTPASIEEGGVRFTKTTRIPGMVGLGLSFRTPSAIYIAKVMAPAAFVDSFERFKRVGPGVLPDWSIGHGPPIEKAPPLITRQQITLKYDPLKGAISDLRAFPVDTDPSNWDLPVEDCSIPVGPQWESHVVDAVRVETCHYARCVHDIACTTSSATDCNRSDTQKCTAPRLGKQGRARKRQRYNESVEEQASMDTGPSQEGAAGPSQARAAEAAAAALMDLVEDD